MRSERRRCNKHLVVVLGDAALRCTEALISCFSPSFVVHTVPQKVGVGVGLISW